MNLEATPSIPVQRRPPFTTGASCTRNEEFLAHKARTSRLLRRYLDFSHHFARWRDPHHTSASVQRRPHVPLFIYAMPVGHGILAVAVILWHYPKWAPIRYRTARSVIVELINRLLGAVRKVHDIIALVPRRPVGNRNVAQRPVHAAVRVEPEHGALAIHRRHARVKHEARPEPPLRVDGSVVAAVCLVLVGGPLRVRPHAAQPPIRARSLGRNPKAILACKDELRGVVLDVRGAAVQIIVFSRDQRINQQVLAML